MAPKKARYPWCRVARQKESPTDHDGRWGCGGDVQKALVLRVGLQVQRGVKIVHWLVYVCLEGFIKTAG